MSGDRTVHAECASFEIVRYDRAGKWYVELRGDRSRQRVTVWRAAQKALYAEVLGGRIIFGLPGGDAFERAVKASR